MIGPPLLISTVVGHDRGRKPDLERSLEYLKSVGCGEILVFGSTARADSGEDSDLDIAVRGIPAEKLFAVYGELMTRLSRPVDLVDLDLQERFGKQLLAGSDIRRIASHAAAYPRGK